MQKKGSALRRAAASGSGVSQAELTKSTRILTSFTPVPRIYNRHDGWTPKRQRDFIASLAEHGCVRRAAAEVNMSQRNCYTLRNAPGAEEFRKAWDAAIDCGLARLKDIVFERAIEGVLVPVLAGGKLMGFQRKHNDALAMFILRHYGSDANGKRTTINYFSTRASAGAGAGDAGGRSGAEASATTVRTVITGGAAKGADPEAAAATLAGFEGVQLDEEARAAIMGALHACAARAQADRQDIANGGEAATDAMENDPAESFIPLAANGTPYRGTLEPPVGWEEVVLPEGEDAWDALGQPVPEWAQHLYPGGADDGGYGGGGDGGGA